MTDKRDDALKQPAYRAVKTWHDGKPVYVAEQPAQPSQSRSDVKPLTDEMITAGARALCKQMAEACGVDARDQWQLYADTFKEDAKAVLEAALAKGDA